jgi:hypothetical protein
VPSTDAVKSARNQPDLFVTFFTKNVADPSASMPARVSGKMGPKQDQVPCSIPTVRVGSIADHRIIKHGSNSLAETLEAGVEGLQHLTEIWRFSLGMRRCGL